MNIEIYKLKHLNKDSVVFLVKSIRSYYNQVGWIPPKIEDVYHNYYRDPVPDAILNVYDKAQPIVKTTGFQLWRALFHIEKCVSKYILTLSNYIDIQTACGREKENLEPVIPDIRPSYSKTWKQILSELQKEIKLNGANILYCVNFDIPNEDDELEDLFFKAICTDSTEDDVRAFEYQMSRYEKNNNINNTKE